jgi:hypothetical protein
LSLLLISFIESPPFFLVGPLRHAGSDFKTPSEDVAADLKKPAHYIHRFEILQSTFGGF